MIEFDESKIIMNGKTVGGIEKEHGKYIAWFQSAKENVRFTEDFTAQDLRAIAAKLEELEKEE